MEIPTIVIPTSNLLLPPEIPRQTIPLPTADLPSYKPMVVPPNNLESPDGVKAETTEKEDTGIRKVDIPFTKFKLPVPENEILITAGGTAVVSVAATLTATAAFKWAVTAMKPLLKQAIGKISGRKKERVNTRM